MVRAVLLDIDGTLLDSNDVHAMSWVETLAEFGFDVPFHRVRAQIGKGADQLIPALIHLPKHSDLGDQIARARTELFKKQYLPQIRPLPRADELLARLRDDGFHVVVATSARADELVAELGILGAEWLLDNAVTGDTIARSKPASDPIRAALRHAAVRPAEAVMLGDTPYDIEAARKCGVRSIALRSGGWDDSALADAVAIYDDPAALLRQYADSPLGRPAASAIGLSGASSR